MTSHTYEQLILDGIQGLPTETLAEITVFIYFLRKRTLDPQDFEDELWSLALRQDLKKLSREEEAHLDEECADDDKLYPQP